eukprot:scaffold1320_cov253-Pinguiococcus_pyrenoidosus.AAC.14
MSLYGDGGPETTTVWPQGRRRDANVLDGDAVENSFRGDRAVEHLLPLDGGNVAQLVVQEHRQTHDGVRDAGFLGLGLDRGELVPEHGAFLLGAADAEHEDVAHTGAHAGLDGGHRQLSALDVPRHHDEDLGRALQNGAQRVRVAHISGNNFHALERLERRSLLGVRVAYHCHDLSISRIRREGGSGGLADVAGGAHDHDLLGRSRSRRAEELLLELGAQAAEFPYDARHVVESAAAGLRAAGGTAGDCSLSSGGISEKKRVRGLFRRSVESQRTLQIPTISNEHQ